MKIAPGGWRYAIGPLVAAPFALVFSLAASALSLATGLLVLFSFRDPERHPPRSGVVAPADGTVTAIHADGGGTRIETRIGLRNVRVVRAPTAGRVRERERIPGGFRPSFSPTAARNERLRFRLESAGGADGERAETDAFVVTVAAGALGRRIRPYVAAGAAVERGDRLGHVVSGNRVTVWLPPSIDREELRVAVGDSVTAGESVLVAGGLEDDVAFDDPLAG